MRRSLSTQHSFLYQPGAAILAPSCVHGRHHAAQYQRVEIHPSTILFEPVVARPSPIGSRNFRPIGRSMSIVATCLVAGVVLGSALIAAVKLLLIAALIGALAALLCKRNHEHTVGLK